VTTFQELSSFIWGVADLIRDVFKRGKYQDVILPFTVLRRIDCVLEPTKEKVLKRYSELHGRIDNLEPQLTQAAGYAFYNTSRFTFERLLEDAPSLADNLRAYIHGFSANMREVLEKFDFENTIRLLDENNLLYLVMQRFKESDLHPDRVDNFTMGQVFEELIRKFNEALNENPGEHYTPREVIRLMVNLLLSQDREMLARNHIVRTVYDPCCGSGGMLTIAKDHIHAINPRARVFLFGQEVNPETWAVSKADLYMKSERGEDAENIKLGSTLSNDQHDRNFNYLITNPPYGKEWKMDEKAVKAEYRKGFRGRFGAGLPRISDGQLLFLQHMIAHMNPLEEEGGRIAIVLNGSPLFTGDAGSGESQIRRWILEKDFLEAIIALPEQLFYNTGIATYIWLLTNRKEQRRRGRVMLVDATAMWVPMRKSLGDKRREISDQQINEITSLVKRFEEIDRVKIFDLTNFGYRKVRVERPLRLNFQVSPGCLERLWQQGAFINLAKSRRKDKSQQLQEENAGREKQQAILAALRGMPTTLFPSRSAFERALDAALGDAGLAPDKALRVALLDALGERDETAEICRDSKGRPAPDKELTDYENVPLGEDIHVYFKREVLPHVPDAWIDEGYTDAQDGGVGRVGYEINFNRYFYKYQPPRPLEEIEGEIHTLQQEIDDLMKDMGGH